MPARESDCRRDILGTAAGLVVLPLLLLVAGLVGTGGLGAEAGYPLAVRDDAGNRLVLARRPERFVSLTMFSDEVLLELVGPGRLAAVTSFAADPAVSNVAGRVAAIPKLEFHAERILSLPRDDLARLGRRILRRLPAGAAGTGRKPRQR
jgi:hypothetical protein